MLSNEQIRDIVNNSGGRKDVKLIEIERCQICGGEYFSLIQDYNLRKNKNLRSACPGCRERFPNAVKALRNLKPIIPQEQIVIIQAIEQHLVVKLHHVSNSIFSSSDASVVISSYLSKDHGNIFWFNSSQSVREYLMGTENPILSFTCGDDVIVWIPLERFTEWFGDEGRIIVHILIKEGEWILRTRRAGDIVLGEDNLIKLR